MASSGQGQAVTEVTAWKVVIAAYLELKCFKDEQSKIMSRKTWRWALKATLFFLFHGVEFELKGGAFPWPPFQLGIEKFSGNVILFKNVFSSQFLEFIVR